MLNKVFIFVFFAHKKYSRSEITFDTDVTWIILTISLLRFCALIVLGSLLSMGGSDKLNILICVLKMNEVLMGLERHEGE